MGWIDQPDASAAGELANHNDIASNAAIPVVIVLVNGLPPGRGATHASPRIRDSQW